MILADSSVWIDYFRSTNRALFARLDSGQVLGHPFVIGEVALGSLRTCVETLALMQQMPQAPTATDGEVMRLVDRYRLHGRGIGWVDAHLLASTRLAADSQLWTRDRRLHAVAEELGIAMPGVTH